MAALSSTARGAAGVTRAVDLIHRRYAEPLRLDELARAAGSSRFHLVRSFRRVVGATPHVYLTRVRLERARELLRGGRPIAEVAVEVGFADQSHLGRRFRDWTGETPGGFRRRAEEARPPQATTSR